jgi:hypothetical protein
MTDTTINFDRISFGAPTAEFDTNSRPHEGGWINITVPVIADDGSGGKYPAGTAYIGVWVYTDQTGVEGKTSDVYDECQRTGYAFRAYRGHERRFEYATELVNLPELLGDPEMDDDDAEAAILDEAAEQADYDLDETFAAALRARLENTERDYTWSLIRAVAALED